MSNAQADTICAIATPPAEGAIGIVRLSGPAARAILARLTRKRRLRDRTLCVATLVHPETGERLDDVLVCLMRAPRSYTGEDVAEIHGHGGVWNMQRLLGACLDAGARLAEPGEFTKRAFLHGRMDLTQAEAVADIIAARSDRALENAQRSLSGALGSAIEEIRQRVVRVTRDLELSVDFVEDEQPLFSAADIMMEGCSEVVVALERLLQTYERGKRLSVAQVALVGPVNAGKSSLFNRLLGRERAIVSAEPGTTRDYVTEDLVIDGFRVQLVDTAGERSLSEASAVEHIGQSRAKAVASQSDLVLLVLDATDASEIAGERTWSSPQSRVEHASPTACFVVLNKSDALAAAAEPPELPAWAHGLPCYRTSATVGTGVPELCQAMLKHVFGAPTATETALLTSQRQCAAVRAACEGMLEAMRALEFGFAPEVVVEHCRSALAALDTLTGRRFTEDVLNSIFADFCIGK